MKSNRFNTFSRLVTKNGAIRKICGLSIIIKNDQNFHGNKVPQTKLEAYTHESTLLAKTSKLNFEAGAFFGKISL